MATVISAQTMVNCFRIIVPRMDEVAHIEVFGRWCGSLRKSNEMVGDDKLPEHLAIDADDVTCRSETSR